LAVRCGPVVFEVGR